MRTALLAIPLLFASCGSSSYAVQGPDGTEHQAVSCRRSIENCWEQAAALCPGGYDVVDKDSDFGVVPTANGPVGTQKHSMMIKCRGGATAMEGTR